MPSEEQDAEMLGVPVWRCHDGWGIRYEDYACCDAAPPEPGRWHAEPVAVALVEVANAGVAWRECKDSEITTKLLALVTALDNLDAALGGGRNG